MYTKNFVNPCPDWATAFLNGFSQVLLQRNPLRFWQTLAWVQMLMLLVLSLW